MPKNSFCRLCVTNCQDHRSLFDENGHENEVHQLMAKYFDPKLFNVGQDIKLNVMCLACWSRIFDFNNFQQFVYQSQKKLVQDVFVISEVQFVSDEIKSAENYQGVYIKSEADESITGSSSENINGENSLQCGQTTIVLPKLELMDDMADDNGLCDDGNEYMLLESNGENDNVEFEKPNSQFRTFEKGQQARSSINKSKIGSFVLDETSSTSTNRNKSTFKHDRNSAQDDNSMSELEEFEEQFSSDDESLLTECEYNNSEYAPEATSLKQETASSSGSAAKDTYIRRSAEDLDKFVAQWKSMLECVICTGTFPKLTLLQQHFREEHPQDEFYVLCCGSKLRFACRIEDHITFHIDPSKYKCGLCGRCYKTRLNLMLHMRKGHDSSSLETEEGFEKLDKDIDDLITKWKNTIGCTLCSYTHSSLILLRQHFQKEHPQEEFHIRCCDRKLKKRRRILEHIRYHVNPSVYKCQSCDRSFDSRANLVMHMRFESHTNNSGSKRYEKEDKEIDDILAQWKSSVECSLCDDTYSSLTALRQHFQEKHRQYSFYYVCCQLKLKERGRILEHIRYHIDPNAFKCDLCGKRYKYEKNLFLHKRSHNLVVTSNENAKNSTKKRTQRDLDDLIPQWKQNLDCVVCSTSFPTYTQLREHFNVEHTNKKFFVKCCKRKLERVYDIAEHIRYHINPNAYKCNICEKLYKHGKNLKIHMQRDHP